MSKAEAKRDQIERKRLVALRSKELFDILTGGEDRKQRELGRYFDVNDGTIRNMLKGKTIPETDTLDKIRAKTGLSHDAILGREPLPQDFLDRYSQAGVEGLGVESDVVSRRSLDEAKAILDQIEAIRARQVRLIQDLEAEKAAEMREAAKPRRPASSARIRQLPNA